LDASDAAVFDHGMSILLNTPGAGDLDEVVRALAEWRREGAPMQLHPGDVGFYWQFGPERTAASLRTWRRDGRILGVGLIDGPDLVRLAVAPEAREDEGLARKMAEDVTRPERGVLSADTANVEALWGGRFRQVLQEDGWEPDEPWIPMVRDLSEPVEDGGLRIEAVGPDRVEDRVAVHRGAFEGSKFDAERWRAMAAGTPYADARCLVGYDDQGAAVAATTVWSAGPGQPGLVEPLGVHSDHHGRGYGKAIAVAAAAALRDMGASSATVCAEGSNTAAVATYRAAGFQPQPEVRDLRRIG
jgi:ribosomal protein S18 acetylase RimI-like enzyme